MAALQSEQVLQETPLPCTCMPQTDTLFLFTGCTSGALHAIALLEQMGPLAA